MKSTKRLLAALLVLVMIIGTMPVFANAAASNFSDFPTGSWSEEAVLAAVNNGLLYGRGDGTIAPKDYLTRAEAAAIINRAFGATVKADISKFTDVNEGEWYYPEIQKAVNMQTIMGVSDTEVNPTGYITRESMFTVIARALVLPGESAPAISKFGDNANVSAWAAPQVAAMAVRGYVNGDDNGNLNPQSYITREEFAQVMHNIFKTYISKSGTVSGAEYNTTVIRTPDVKLTGVTVNGDLIVGDGMGAGDLDLTDVKVKGRILFRGGEGKVTFIGKGNSVGEYIIVHDVNGVVNFHNYRTETIFDDIVLDTEATFLKRTTGGGSGVSYANYSVITKTQSADGTYSESAPAKHSARRGSRVDFTGFTVPEGFTASVTYSPDNQINNGSLVVTVTLSRIKYEITLPDGTKKEFLYGQKMDGSVDSAQETSPHDILDDIKKDLEYEDDGTTPTGYEVTFEITDGNGNPIENIEDITESDIAEGKVHISVIKTPIEYTIEYDMNGIGEEPDDAYKKYTVDALPFTLPDVAHTLTHTFEGWFDNAELSGERVYSIPAGTALGTKKFYAKWVERTTEPTTYTITLDGKDYTLIHDNAISSAKASDNETLGDVAGNPPNEWEEFEAFYEKDDDTTPIALTDKPNKSMEIVVKWKLKTYVITYNMNGIGDEPADEFKSYTKDDLPFTLPDVEDTLTHTFEGWYDNEELSGDAITVIPEDTELEPKVFYAKWNPILTPPPVTTYTITYHMNGFGTEPADSYKSYTEDDLPFTLPDVEDVETHTFEGWYDNEEFSGDAVTVIPSNTVLENKEYYAKWEIKANLGFTSTADEEAGEITVYVTLDKLPGISAVSEMSLEFDIQSEIQTFAIESDMLEFVSAQSLVGGTLVASADGTKLDWSTDSGYITKDVLEAKQGKLFELKFKSNAEDEKSIVFVYTTTDIKSSVATETAAYIEHEHAILVPAKPVVVPNARLSFEAEQNAATGEVTLYVTLDKMPKVTSISNMTLRFDINPDVLGYVSAQSLVGGTLNMSADGTELAWFTTDDYITQSVLNANGGKLFAIKYNPTVTEEKDVEFDYTFSEIKSSVDGETPVYDEIGYAVTINKGTTEPEKAVLGFESEEDTDGNILVHVTLDKMPEGVTEIANMTLKLAMSEDVLEYVDGSGISNIGGTLSVGKDGKSIAWNTTANYLTEDVLEAKDNKLFTLKYKNTATVDTNVVVSYTDTQLVTSSASELTVDEDYITDDITISVTAVASDKAVLGFESEEDADGNILVHVTLDKMPEGVTEIANISLDIAMNPDVLEYISGSGMSNVGGQLNVGRDGTSVAWYTTSGYLTADTLAAAGGKLFTLKYKSVATADTDVVVTYADTQLVTSSATALTEGEDYITDGTTISVAAVVPPSPDKAVLGFESEEDADGNILVHVTLDKMPEGVTEIANISLDIAMNPDVLEYVSGSGMSNIGGQLNVGRDGTSVAWYTTSGYLTADTLAAAGGKLFTLKYKSVATADTDVVVTYADTQLVTSSAAALTEGEDYITDDTTISVTAAASDKAVLGFESEEDAGGNILVHVTLDKMPEGVTEIANISLDIAMNPDVLEYVSGSGMSNIGGQLNVGRDGTSVAWYTTSGYLTADTLAAADGKLFTLKYKSVATADTDVVVTYADTQLVTSSAAALTEGEDYITDDTTISVTGEEPQATYTVRFFDGVDETLNFRGSCDKKEKDYVTQEEIDNILGAPDTYSAQKGYIDSDGKTHYIYPELWYKVGTQWEKFVPEEVSVTSDIDVYLLTRYISFTYSTDLTVKGVEIPDIVVNVPYDSDTNIGESVLDTLTALRTSLARALNLMDNNGTDPYEIIINKLVDLSLVDADGNILNKEIAVPLHRVITGDYVTNTIDTYIEDNIDNEEFIADVLRNDTVVDMLIGSDEIKLTIMQDDKIYDESVIKIFLDNDELVEWILTNETFRREFITSDESFEYIIDDLKVLLDDPRYHDMIVDVCVQFVIDVYFEDNAHGYDDEHIKALEEYIDSVLNDPDFIDEIEAKPELRGMFKDEIKNTAKYSVKDDIKSYVKSWIPDKIEEDREYFDKSVDYIKDSPVILKKVMSDMTTVDDSLIDDYIEGKLSQDVTAEIDAKINTYLSDIDNVKSAVDTYFDDLYDTYYDDMYATFFDEYYDTEFNALFEEYYGTHVHYVAKKAYDNEALNELVIQYVHDYTEILVTEYADETLEQNHPELVDAIDDLVHVRFPDMIREKYFEAGSEIKSTVDSLIVTEGEVLIAKYVADELDAETDAFLYETIKDNIESIAGSYVDKTIDADLKELIDNQINEYMEKLINDYISGNDRDTLGELIPTYAKDAVDALKDTDAFKNTIADFTSGNGVRVNEGNIIFVSIMADLLADYDYNKIKAQFLPENLAKVIEIVGDDVARKYVNAVFDKFVSGMNTAVDSLESDISADITGTEYTFSTSPKVIVAYMEDFVVNYYNKLADKARAKLYAKANVHLEKNTYAKELVDTNWIDLYFDKGAAKDEIKSGYKLKDNLMDYYDVTLDMAVLLHDAIVWYGSQDEMTLEEKLDGASALIGAYANKFNDIMMDFINNGELPKGYTKDEIISMAEKIFDTLNGKISALDKIEDLYDKNEDKINSAIDKAVNFYKEYLDRDYSNLDLAAINIYADGEVYPLYQIVLEMNEDAFDIDDLAVAIDDSTNYHGISKVEDAMAKVKDKIAKYKIAGTYQTPRFIVDAYGGTFDSRDIKGYATGSHTAEMQRYLAYVKD